MSGRSPPSYCTLTLIAMQGHQQKGRQTNTSSNNKDKSNTIIETSTAEDHDDENLHNPSARPRYSLLFLTFSALVANPKKTTLHGGQSRSWSAEQGKKTGVDVSPTGGVFPYLPHHLDLASEDSVGHSTCKSVLTLTLTLTQTALSRCCYGRWGTAESPTHSPATRLHVL